MSAQRRPEPTGYDVEGSALYEREPIDERFAAFLSALDDRARLDLEQAVTTIRYETPSVAAEVVAILTELVQREAARAAYRSVPNSTDS